MTDARAYFESRLEEIKHLAFFYFKNLDPDAREEAVQNTVVLAYRSWTRLVERGKTGAELFKSVMWFACRHTRQGRQGGGSSNAKCVLDYARRRRNNVWVDRGFNLAHFVGTTSSIPDTVAFRVDMPAFFATLTDRDRRIAQSLAIHGTSVTAIQFGVTPGSISQARTRLRKKYDEFFGEV